MIMANSYGYRADREAQVHRACDFFVRNIVGFALEIGTHENNIRAEIEERLAETGNNYKMRNAHTFYIRCLKYLEGMYSTTL